MELPLGRDQGNWSTAGLAMSKGYIFWKDYLHFNFPGLAILFAMAFHFTDDPRVATMLVNTSGMLVFLLSARALLKQTYTDKAAEVFTLIFCLLVTLLMNTQLIAQKDTMAIAFIYASSYFHFKSQHQLRFKYEFSVLAGVMVLLAALMKPLFALAGPTLALHHLWLTLASNGKTASLRVAFSHCLSLLTGALIIILIGFIYLYTNNAVQDFYTNAIEFSLAYSGLKPTPLTHVLFVLLYFIVLLGYGNPIVWFASIAAGASQIKNTGKAFYFLYPLTVCTVIYIIQKKAINYQALAVALCLLPIAAIGFLSLYNKIISRLPKPSLKLLTYAFTSTFLIIPIYLSSYVKFLLPLSFGVMERDHYLKREQFITEFVSPTIKEKVAQWIKLNTQTEDRILVWGMECEIYTLSNRMYASMAPFDLIISNKGFYDANPEWMTAKRTQFLNDLIYEKPKVIIIVHDDTNRFEPIPSSESVLEIPGFSTFINQNYRKLTILDRLHIYGLSSSSFSPIPD